MRYFFLDRSIGRRLGIGFTIMLILVILTGIAGAIGIRSILSTVRWGLDTGFQLTELELLARQELRSAQRQEALYLANYERLGLESAHTFLNAAQSHIARFKRYLSDIEAQVNALEYETSLNFAAITELIEKYEGDLVGLVDSLETRGVDQEGYVGALKTIISALKTELEDDEEGARLVFQVEKAFNQYLLISDVPQSAALRAEVKALKDHLNTATALSEDKIADLQTMIDEYLATFENLYRLNTRIDIAIRTNERSITRINSLFHEVESLADTLVTEARGSIFSHVEVVQTVILLTIGIAVVVGFGLALIITRSVTRPLNQIIHATEKISAGDLEQDVPDHARDEIGALARAFNEMTANLRRMIEAEHANQERTRQLQQSLIDAQQQAIRELSTPIIPVMDGVIVMPLVGSIDTQRARDITRALLAGIGSHNARTVIIDITGVSVIDSGVADHLNKTVQAAQLKGARTIITGISDAVAETIVDLGIDWEEIDTLRDLQTGLRVAANR